MDLQTKLVSLRKQKGLTQLDLAERLDVSRQAISRWEVGAAVPSTDNLRVLSELYGVSVDYLLNDDREVNEFQEPIEQKQKEKSKIKYYKGALIFAVALVVVILIMLCVFSMRGKENNQINPIENMETIEEEFYPSVTFSLD